MSNVIMFDIDEHNSGAVCIPSILAKSLPHEPDIPIKENFNFAAALESVYPLLDLVFAYLPYNDLKTCLSINKFWKSTAKKEAEKRNHISWMNLEQTSSKCSVLKLRTSPLYLNNNRRNIIMFYNPKKIRMNKYICNHTNNGLVRKTFKEYIDDNVLHSNIVNYCFISSSGNISPPRIECNNNISNSRILSSVYIPKINGIRIHMLRCEPSKMKRNFRSDLKSTEIVKCVLPFLFDVPRMNSIIKSLISVICDREQQTIKNFALGGGIVDTVGMNKKVRVFPKNEISLITFIQDTTCEDCTFDAFSLVYDDKETDDIDSKIKKFKDNTIVKSRSILFKFSCFDRDNKCCEDGILQKYFPNTVLLGTDVNGEIGVDKILNDDRDMRKESTSHVFTTILVLITW